MHFTLCSPVRFLPGFFCLRFFTIFSTTATFFFVVTLSSPWKFISFCSERPRRSSRCATPTLTLTFGGPYQQLAGRQPPDPFQTENLALISGISFDSLDKRLPLVQPAAVSQYQRLDNPLPRTRTEYELSCFENNDPQWSLHRSLHILTLTCVLIVGISVEGWCFPFVMLLYIFVPYFESSCYGLVAVLW